MKTAIGLICTAIAVLLAQASVIAQTTAGTVRPTDIVISSGTAILVAVIGSIGTVVAAFLGSWGAIRIQVATQQATCNERTRAICHTLDEHRKDIDRLQDRIK
jgi:phage-related minor tail protein